MLRLDVQGGHSLLAVDSRPATPAQADEATKVRREGACIVAIGKHLTDYDALDTGVFVCSPLLFEALDEACREGDTTLSGGVRRLAARRLMLAVETGNAEWWDIDTLSDLAAAASALGARVS
jgi:choline kinase